MRKIYIITGAAGHLGNTLVRLLAKSGCQVRGLLLPGERAQTFENVRYFYGDVTRPDSIEPLFEGVQPQQAVVMHTAGIVDIMAGQAGRMQQVNVEGTANMIRLCDIYDVRRLVYVSSVHAIPEQPAPAVITEVTHFSPDAVKGGYARTKAQASQLVLDAAANGLYTVIVHPSGILGPYGGSGNYLVQLIWDYMTGRLPACVRGGYDFVDVRDVAAGCLAAAERGRRGACYILSNRHYTIRQLLQMVRGVCGGRRLPELPVFAARAVAPLLGLYAKCRRCRPLYTSYSLQTLCSNDRFSHDRATAELGYRPRDLRQTVADTVHWLQRYGGRPAFRLIRPQPVQKGL